MKTRWLRGALALCLLACLSCIWAAPAFAEDEADEAEAYQLWIGGVQVTSENRGRIAEVLAESGVSVSGIANYDPDNAILTLDNFQLSGGGYVTSFPFWNGYTYGVEAMIYTLDPIQIDLWGDNAVTMETAGAERFLLGILSRADLLITGNNGATLTVRSGSPLSGRGLNIYHSIGIQARDEAVERCGTRLEIAGECTITARGGDDSPASSPVHSRTLGIQAPYVSLRDGCQVLAQSGDTTLDAYACAAGLQTELLSLSGGASLTAAGVQTAIDARLDLAEGYTGAANTALDGVSGDSLPLEQWPEAFATTDDPLYRYAHMESGGPVNPPEPGPTRLIEAVNVSCAGGWEITNSSISAFYESADRFPQEILDAMVESERMEGFRFRYMAPAVRLLEDAEAPTPLYLRASAAPTLHELILYSREKLDPAGFTITGGALQREDFTGGHYGDGAGILYWYRTVIEIPAESAVMEILYQHEQAALLEALRVADIMATYLTQLFNAGMEEDERGNITAFTVEAAGFNLPTDPAAYSMEGCTLRSLTGPDETGKLTLVFDHDDPAELIQWKDLLIWDQLPFYFDQYKVEVRDGAYYCNNDTENGAWASLPTPYYTLRRGGTLEGRSAPVVITGEGCQILYAGIAAWEGEAQAIGASYGADGAMTGVEILTADAPLALTAGSGAAAVKLMVTDETFSPLCAPKTVRVEQPET